MSGQTEHVPAKLKVHVTKNTWRIMNFSKWDFGADSEGDEISLTGLRSSTQRYLLMCKSSSFLIPDPECQEVKFHAYLWRKGSDNQHLSPWLSLAVSTDYDTPFLWHLPEYDPNRCYAWITGTGEKRECMSRLPGGEYGGEHNFYKRDFVLYEDVMNQDKGLLKDDHLTIVCEIRALTYEFSVIESWPFRLLESESEVTQDMEHTLAKDVKRMFDSGQSSDVTLVANDGVEFPAHATLLASRSPVFAAMFKTDMKEKLERRVNIEDLNSQAVRSLLDFVYTDAVPDSSVMVTEQLLHAAHKYDMPRLKTLCEEAMAASLKTENAAELMSTAHLYNAAQLLSAAKRFLVRHAREVVKTRGWEILLTRSPHLTGEIIVELADLVCQLTSSE